MNKLMIDLETLSLRPDAFITAIGLVVFNDNYIVHSEGIFLDMDKSFGHIDAGTVRWWNEQDPEIRKRVWGGKVAPETATIMIRELYQSYQPEEIWANSPSFDFVVIREWYKNMKAQRGWNPGQFPLGYRAQRDVRTLKNIALQKNISAGGWANKAPHDPVADAEADACAVIEILQRVRA